MCSSSNTRGGLAGGEPVFHISVGDGLQPVAPAGLRAARYTDMKNALAMGSRLRTAVIVAALSAGCGSPTAPDPTIDDLRRAPLTVTVDGTNVALQASLWRNLMPSIPPVGSPLVATIRLAAAVRSASVDRMWLLRGEETWETTPERLAGRSEWIARDGPQWTPGSRVDVVARVRSKDGRAQLVRVADQIVEAA